MSILMLIIVSMLYVTVVSTYYVYWFKSGRNVSKYIVEIVMVVFASILVTKIVLIIFQIVVMNIIILIIFIILFVIVFNKLTINRSFIYAHPQELKGIKYYLYDDKGKLANAWFDGKRIIITRSLAEILDKKELYIVLLHEKGHSESKVLSWLNVFLRSSWIVIIMAIISIPIYGVIIELLEWGEIRNASSIMLLLYFIGVIVTATILPLSWISEHEADYKTLLSDGSTSYRLLNVLVKIHVYNTLSKERLTVLDPHIELFVYPKLLHKINGIRIFMEVIKSIFISVPYSVIEFIKKPVYITHPPIWLRASYIERVRFLIQNGSA